MNEAAAAGAKERDPLADVERQGPISWALHSIRTRYSLATAVFLLLALAMFYIGGRIVLVHLVHDAERQVKEIGVDVSRLAYRRADAVRQAAADAFAAADGGRLDPAKCVEAGGFSLAAEFAADGKFAGGALRGADGAARPVLAEELAPYAEALSRWISTSASPEARKAATGIVRVGGVSHFVSLVPAGAGGALMLGMPFDSTAFTLQVNDSLSGLEVRVTDRKAEISVRELPAENGRAPQTDGFGIVPMFSSALNFYSGGFWDLRANPFEAVFTLRDIVGNAISMVTVSLPKSFTSVTETAVGRLACFIAVGGILFVLPLFWFQSRVLLNPLTKMTKEVSELGRRNSDVDCPRLEWRGKDEFALLAVSVNRMLETISARTVSIAQADARHQALIACLPDALAIFDPVGRVVAITKQPEAADPIPGFTPGDVPDAAVFGQGPVDSFLRTLGEIFRGRKVGKIKFEASAAGGGVRHFDLRVTRMDEYFALAVVRDVTEEASEHRLRLAAEARAHDSMKRESLTQLAAGIAHDMNNVLSIVLNAAESDGADPSGDSSETLRTIREAVRRGSEMMRELRTFAGESRIHLVRVDPNLLFEDAKPLAEHTVGDNVIVTFEPGSGMPDVDADPGQFWKVFFNIIKNAGEAIGERPGTIRVSVKPFVMTEAVASGFISAAPLQSGAGVLFEIRDDGPGIPASLLPRLFDPFVSSKAIGRGLGLATARTIVETHGGGIAVDSQPDRGTVFRIFLPESRLPKEQPDGGGQAAASVADGAARPSGEVLVVDDDPGIRRTSAILLKGLGRTAHVAKDHHEALAVVRRHAESLGAIVLDADLGATDSVRLLASLRISAPGVPVVVSSGSSEDSIRELFRAEPYDLFLAKPYTLAELKGALAAVEGKA
jgi:signal transduction histidine kinase/CheY-like chemotaxis protein